MIKQNNKLVNYDSFYSNKINNNCYNISYSLDVIISNIKSIHLRSVEIPISICNIRAPYNTLTYIIKTISNVTTTHTIQLQDKVYNSIYTLISDLNGLMILNIQPKLQTNEIAPIFTVSTSSIDMATPILNFIFHIFAMYSHQYYEKMIILNFFTSQISKNKIK